MTAAELRLCVDVGTVSTDAVLMDANDRPLAKRRLPPAANAEEAVRGAIGATVEAAGADPACVTRAMVGAASVMEVLLKRRSFDRVAVIRIGAPLTRALPPLCRWPADLRRAVSAGEVVVAAWAGPAIWRTDRGLPVAGPAAFGYDTTMWHSGHDGR